MGDDGAGPLIGWSLGSVRDASDPRPFDTLAFPCVFRFKAIGRAADDLVSSMLERVAAVVGRAIDQGSWSVRTSGAGRYTCLTVDVQVTSGQQVYDIYEALKQDARVTHLL
jgi:putative lipoic acid-binding regulatory protein